MLVLNLSLGSELVPNHPAKIPFDHVILEFWKTDKVFTFAADCPVALGDKNFLSSAEFHKKILVEQIFVPKFSLNAVALGSDNLIFCT